MMTKTKRILISHNHMICIQNLPVPNFVTGRRFCLQALSVMRIWRIYSYSEPVLSPVFSFYKGSTMLTDNFLNHTEISLKISFSLLPSLFQKAHFLQSVSLSCFLFFLYSFFSYFNLYLSFIIFIYLFILLFIYFYLYYLVLLIVDTAC